MESSGYSLVVMHRLLIVVASLIAEHGLSCSMASGIFPEQESNLCLLHWQVDSLQLSHEGSPWILIPWIFLFGLNLLFPKKHIYTKMFSVFQSHAECKFNSLWHVKSDIVDCSPINKFTYLQIVEKNEWWILTSKILDTLLAQVSIN